MITSGEGKYKVFLKKINLDNELIYILGGGEKSHVGAVVICEVGKKTRILKIDGHYDHVVLTPIAEAAFKKYKTKVVAIGGVHVNNATKDEIDILVKNCGAFIKKI
jgi:hypothetical protein